ncbi:PTS ascorbate transporter subunit IIC [Anaerobacillus alkalidiazotrophicus]|uniref:Ascorbate-specific PTS system EIIC component n=1 Tax=Anaerobacillus alkalidiazotrophicus TaxID=472963 RepID=A0A1S2M673_9BACI|nr:PTS ascorbate transporter subunit IIC [Anaerobacillus alkalidiazotrophicus]OIJ20134.1 PTS ascorbate transporter subunit IIC [Anaerobacillus alkalidiazotrophicus]
MNLTQLLNKGLLGEPAFLLGMIAFIGLLLQRSSIEKMINGTIKTMLGYILIQIGGMAAGTALSNLSAMIQRGFQIIGIIPHNETVVALAQINYGHEIAWIMLIGMVLHLCIARFTPIKYIFLTGHHILYMASMLASLLVVTALSGWQVYILGGLFLALSMSLGPAIAQPYVKKVVGHNQVAIGHFNSVGYVLAGLVAQLTKSKEVKEEPKKLQRVQSFFQDHMVVVAVFTFFLFFISSLFVSPEGISEMFSERHFIVVSFIQSIWFTGGVYIILAGVRMLVSEIIPAFQGIAQRVVPKSIPALDCPILFPYSPIAAMIGFLLSFFGGFVAMAALLFYQYTTIIPGVIPHFFSGGAAGVIAYKVGGRRGLVVASFVHGFVITLLPVMLVPLLSGLGYIRATFADSDFSVIGILLHKLIEFLFA